MMTNRFTAFPPMFIALALLLSSCLSDIRSDLVRQEPLKATHVAKGKHLLTEAWKAQGLDKLSAHEVYSFEGVDVWKGLLGKTGKVWPDNESRLSFKYAVGTFDSQVSFLDGKRKGTTAGLQSWRYYEQEPGSTLNFLDKNNERITFGLAAYQYFVEMVDRLRKAPIIQYAGMEELHNKEYETVFVTWKQTKPSKDLDQYIVYIDPQSKQVDFVKFTIRENYLHAPGGKMTWGMIHYDDFRSIDGIRIPHRQSLYSFGVKKDLEKYLHRMEIENFSFDSFDKNILYPDPDIQSIGNSKQVSD
ncbi:MAG: hypothetical protein AAF587_26075 [Bacteroidota bacterium]